MPRPLARLLAALAGSLLVLCTAPAHAQPWPSLFASTGTGVGGAAIHAVPPLPRMVSRQRVVSVDLARIAPAQAPAPTLALALFDGEVIAVDFVRIDVRGPGNFTWYGRVRDYDRSDVVLTVVDGRVAGGIGLASMRDGQAHSYLLNPVDESHQVLQELDPALMPPEHPPGWTGELPPGVQPDPPNVTIQADSGAQVDILIVYSDESAAAAGGGIGAAVQYAVDRANLAYTNSGIATQLRLVYSGPANYSESGDFSTDLTRLQATNDGYMDNVHALRDTYAADVVSLFIESNAYCGIGFLNSSATSAFTVVNRGCSGGYLSLAHEVGHNFGARHDPFVDSATSPYAWGHGYVYKPGQWRTVMAYDNDCNASGFTCSRLPYFSNPNVNYNAVATGTANTHYNARVHNDRAVTVANFRAAGAVTAPTASTGAATAIGSTGATLNGTVSSNGASTTVVFEYGNTTSYGSTANAGGSPLAAGASNQAVSASVSGLAACTTYHFRVSASNSAGATQGGDTTFVTTGCPSAPTVTAGVPSNVTAISATFNGTVLSNGAAASVTFKYGLTNAYGSTVTALQSPVTTSGTPAAVSAAVNGLACGTTYHWAVSATNGGGTTQTVDQSFATAACGGGALAPTATTLAVSTVGGASVLNGIVSSNGAATTVTFQYGVASYASTLAADQGVLAANASNQAVTAAPAGLACNTTYQYRVVASNSAGSTNGNGLTFTTPACGTGAATTTTLVSTANPAVAGTSVTVLATVTGAAPTGPVGFTQNGAGIAGCAAVPLTGSGNIRTASCVLPPQAVGSYAIVAQFAGDGANLPSSSTPPLQQSMVAAGGLVGTVIANPYGPLQVTGGTLVGSTVTITGSTAILQLGAVVGGATVAEIDFAGLHVPPGMTLTLRSGAAGQTLVLKNSNGEASALAGSIVAQGGNGAPPPRIEIRNANGIAVGATGTVQGPGGLTLNALATPTSGGPVTNAGSVDGGSVLHLFGTLIRGGGAFVGDEVDVHTTGTVNNPVAGAHYLGNSLQLYPSTGSDVNVLVNAYGSAPQFINLKVNGNALLWMPSAWPGGSALQPNSAPLPAGAVRPAGASEPGYGGGSIIVQSTGAMTLYRGGSNDLVFPGGIALKAGGALDLNGVLVNQGWTTTGKAFQGIYLEAPQIVSATPVQILSNDLNWTNFSVLPSGHFQVSRLKTQPNGTAIYVPADSEAPHRNTYSVLIDAAANLQCWTCLVDYAAIAVQ